MSSKPTNPKDSVGIRKWRQLSVIPFTVIWELGAAMLEGARKYGRHNYREAGVRASVYVDAAMGHIMQWWEGEDIDRDSRISHLTKAIACLTILRDGMIQDRWVDDRPPSVDLDKLRDELQAAVDHLFEQHPNPLPAAVRVAPDPVTPIDAFEINGEVAQHVIDDLLRNYRQNLVGSDSGDPYLATLREMNGID